jgi:hypothetical protein
VLWEFLDGELDASVTAQVSAPVEFCGHCFQVTAMQKEFLEAIAALREPSVAPMEVKAGIVAALAAAGRGWRRTNDD